MFSEHRTLSQAFPSLTYLYLPGKHKLYSFPPEERLKKKKKVARKGPRRVAFGTKSLKQKNR